MNTWTTERKQKRGDAVVRLLLGNFSHLDLWMQLYYKRAERCARPLESCYFFLLKLIVMILNTRLSFFCRFWQKKKKLTFLSCMSIWARVWVMFVTKNTFTVVWVILSDCGFQQRVWKACFVFIGWHHAPEGFRRCGGQSFTSRFSSYWFSYYDSCGLWRNAKDCRDPLIIFTWLKTMAEKKHTFLFFSCASVRPLKMFYFCLISIAISLF